MTLRPDLLGTVIAPVRRAWTSTDAILYALGVGAGGDDLQFTTENSHGVTQQVVPTFAALKSVALRRSELGTVRRSQLLHAGQSVTLHRALPVEGDVVVSGRITGVRDARSGVQIETTSRMRTGDGSLLAEMTSELMVRGEQGFGPQHRASIWAEPGREPDVRVAFAVRRDLTLLYRLSGDRNPLHSDPWAAKEAGFDAPIVHGLCTYGICGRLLVRALCDGDPARFGSLSGRFVAPVAVGAELVLHAWRTDDGAVFQAFADGVRVVNRGVFTLAAADVEPPGSLHR